MQEKFLKLISDSKISLDQLRTFLVLGRLEHLTKASEELYLSQAAVSQQLKTLEKNLGVQLFERQGRRIYLSSVGKSLMQPCLEVLLSVQVVEELANSYKGLELGTLSIAASHTVGIHWLPKNLAPFADSYKGIEIKVELDNSETALKRLIDGYVDCAIIEGKIPYDTLDTLIVEQDVLVAAVSANHELAKLENIDSKDLLNYRYLSREPGSGTEALAARVIGPSYKKGSVYEFGGAEAIRSAILAGMGYGVISKTIIENDLINNSIIIMELNRPSVSRKFKAVRRKGNKIPSLESFWEHLSKLSF